MTFMWEWQAMASTGDKKDKNLHTYKEMTVVEPLERRERYI